MKHFIYLSDAKIERHFEQIQQSFFSTAKIDKLRLKLGFGEADLSDTTRPPNRYRKLAGVLSELAERESIGTLEQPKLYFRGKLRMKYGIYPNTELVYFSGLSDNTIVGLVGSLKHFEDKQVETLTCGGGSSAVGVTRSLVQELNMQPIIDQHRRNLEGEVSLVDDSDDYPLQMVVGKAHRLIVGPYADVEFVAIRLDVGTFEGRKTILGTPFYVALAP
jgi:hypothetical protein